MTLGWGIVESVDILEELKSENRGRRGVAPRAYKNWRRSGALVMPGTGHPPKISRMVCLGGECVHSSVVPGTSPHSMLRGEREVDASRVAEPDAA